MIFLKSTPVPIEHGVKIHLATSSAYQASYRAGSADTFCGRTFTPEDVRVAARLPRNVMCETCVRTVLLYVGPELLGQHLELEPGESWEKR